VILLVIGGVEQNPGPGVEGESFIYVNCSACERIGNSATGVDGGLITAVERLRLYW
jgi:hypothetical protein